MNEVYYSPEVKKHDPMGRKPMDGIGISFKSSEVLNPIYSRKCLDYNPINKKNGLYQEGYKVKLFSESLLYPSSSFQKKENEVMNYHPKDRKMSGSSYLKLFKGVTNKENPFSGLIKKIIKTVQNWVQFFKRTNT